MFFRSVVLASGSLSWHRFEALIMKELRAGEKQERDFADGVLPVALQKSGNN
jgi:hypothetical protein